MKSNPKLAWIDKLYYDVGKQTELKLAVARKEENGTAKWSKHRDYLDAQSTDGFMAGVNNRTILTCEIVLDFDPVQDETAEQLRQRFAAALTKLEAEGYRYSAYSTGSRGYHIHLFFSQELTQLSSVRRKQVKEFFISKFGAEKLKAGNNVMIALEGVPHWKTGKPKTLLKEQSGVNPAAPLLNEYSENEPRKQPNEEQKVIKTSFYEDARGRLYEQVTGLRFAVYDPATGSVSYLDMVFQGSSKIVPIADELEAKQAVLLPSQVEGFSTVQELLEEIRIYINRYCDLSPDFVRFASWYVLLTAVADKLNTVPYLRFLGDTGTGKSRSVDIIGRICYKPMLATACITPAPIYRMINLWGGTLILEEADLKQSDTTNEVVKILNAGFERGKPVLRSTKDSPDNIQVLPVFGPKIFATRRRFDDSALEARCLTEIMKETNRKDIPPLLPKAAFKEQEHIRNKLLMFRFRYRDSIDSDAVLTLDFGELEPRLRQVAASFAVIFANFPEVMADFKAMMKEYQRELIETRSTTFEGTVVAALLECLPVYVTNVTNVTHVTVTAADIADKMPLEKGQRPNARTIGKVLRSLGLVTELRRVDGKAKRALKLDKESLETLVRRYVPKDEQEEAVTLVTSVTSITCDREGDTANSQKRLNSIFSELAASSMDGLVPREKLDETAKLNSIGPEAVESWLVLAKANGDVYEPRDGFLALVSGKPVQEVPEEAIADA